jgi:hypothetical protein
MAFGMISGTVGAAPGSAVTIGTNQAGGLTQMNVAMIGGIMTGSNNQFSSLPVAGLADALGMPANAFGTNGTLVLSSSFAGYSGSIIQALNHLKALQAADAGGDVSGPGSSTDNALVKFDGVGGKTLLNTGVILSDSDGLSAIASIALDDAGTIGPASVADLITLTGDGDLTFKDGAYDLNVASHDGTNGLALAGTIVTATAGNLNLNTGVTAGTAAAGKVVALDAQKDVAGVRNLSSEGIVLAASSLSGTALSIGGGDFSVNVDGLAVGPTIMATSTLSGTALSVGGGDFTVNVDGQVSAPLANFTTQVGTATLVASTVVSGTALSIGGGDFSVNVDGLAVGPTIMATSTLSGTALSVGGGDFSVNVHGVITAASADIDDIQIDGATIGHTNDTNIITLANQEMTIANDVDFTIGKAGGLNLADGAVLSTAAEINLIDGSSAGTVVNSKAVIYGAAGQVAATTVSGASNISANAFIMAGTNAAGQSKLFKLSVDGGIMLVSEAGTP